MFAAGVLFGGLLIAARSGEPTGGQAKADDKPRNPAAEAVRVQPAPAERPEQKLTEHDKSDKFNPAKPAPVNPALKDQPNQGRITGFEFSRDPLGADKPFQTLAEVMKKEAEAKPKVT